MTSWTAAISAAYGGPGKSLELEPKTQQNSSRRICLCREHAEVSRAVEIQRRRSEVNDIEYVEHLGRKRKLIAFRQMEVLTDCPIQIPCGRHHKLIEWYLSVSAEQRSRARVVYRA